MPCKDRNFSKKNSAVNPDLKFREIKNSFLVCIGAHWASELFFLERPVSITAKISRENCIRTNLMTAFTKIILKKVILSFGQIWQPFIVQRQART